MVLEARREGAGVSHAQLVWAVVDSGADRTVLPLSVAVRLAILDSLQRDRRSGVGVDGRAFPLWSSIVPVYGQVVGDRGDAWGPRFLLDPMFADADVALLGREDFFRAFTITFQEHATTPVYHLDPA